MYETVLLLCKQVDALTHKHVPSYQEGTLHKALSETRKIKGRLLYYYPMAREESSEDCGSSTDPLIQSRCKFLPTTSPCSAASACRSSPVVSSSPHPTLCVPRTPPKARVSEGPLFPSLSTLR